MEVCVERLGELSKAEARLNEEWMWSLEPRELMGLVVRGVFEAKAVAVLRLQSAQAMMLLGGLRGEKAAEDLFDLYREVHANEASWRLMLSDLQRLDLSFMPGELVAHPRRGIGRVVRSMTEGVAEVKFEDRDDGWVERIYPFQLVKIVA